MKLKIPPFLFHNLNVKLFLNTEWQEIDYPFLALLKRLSNAKKSRKQEKRVKTTE